MNAERFYECWQQEPLPLVAILRGIAPPQAEEAAEILISCGFRWLEVPLNSPSALESIALMRKHAGDKARIGAGTVLTTEQVDEVADHGGQLIVSPNCNPAVIRRSRERGLISLPGVTTPTEAFNAIEAGASGLKLFPAEQMSPAVVKAFRAVLPAKIACLPVGGITPDAQTLRTWLQAGANGFGLGGALYQASMSFKTLHVRASAFHLAWLAARGLEK